jgi:hypothetical protein
VRSGDPEGGGGGGAFKVPFEGRRRPSNAGAASVFDARRTESYDGGGGNGGVFPPADKLEFDGLRSHDPGNGGVLPVLPADIVELDFRVNNPGLPVSPIGVRATFPSRRLRISVSVCWRTGSYLVVQSSTMESVSRRFWAVANSCIEA